MDRGAAGGINLGTLSKQLPGLAQIAEDTEVGLDGQGYIVTKTTDNAGYFSDLQNNLVQHLVKERGAKFTALKDRSINLISIPNDITMQGLRNALRGLDAAGQRSRTRLEAYFRGDLLEYTQKNSPELYQEILATPLSEMDYLVKRAREAREEQELALAIANSNAEPNLPATLPAQRERTPSPPPASSSPKPVAIPQGQEDLFAMAKKILGSELSEQAIVLGIERNVFNFIQYYPKAKQEDAFKQNKAMFLENIRKLQVKPDREQSASMAQSPVISSKDSAASPATKTSGTTSGEPPLPTSVSVMTDHILALPFTSSWQYHNAAFRIGKISEQMKGKLDHPDLLKFLDDFTQKAKSTPHYHDKPDLSGAMHIQAEKLPESQFKRRLLKQFPKETKTSQPSTQHQPVVQSSRTTNVPPQAATPSPSMRQRAAQTTPPPAAATIARQIAGRYQLNATELETFLAVFGNSQNVAEIENALAACSYLYKMQSPFPFKFLLEGMKTLPGGCRSNCIIPGRT